MTAPQAKAGARQQFPRALANTLAGASRRAEKISLEWQPALSNIAAGSFQSILRVQGKSGTQQDLARRIRRRLKPSPPQRFPSQRSKSGRRIEAVDNRTPAGELAASESARNGGRGTAAAPAPAASDKEIKTRRGSCARRSINRNALNQSLPKSRSGGRKREAEFKIEGIELEAGAGAARTRTHEGRGENCGSQ